MTGHWILPRLDLLQSDLTGGDAIARDDLISRAEELERTIGAFDLVAKVVEVRPGPIFTAFNLELGNGVRIAQIRSLGPDIGRALGGSEVSVETVPGSSLLSILIANPCFSAITIGELIDSQAFDGVVGSLPFALGKTIGGRAACYDVEALRHLLIGGTTGSGKSMGLHSILTSLLFRVTPNDLRLLLIDTKVAEFAPYEGIPHLLAPVVSETDKARRALAWLADHVDERFRLMSELGVKNLQAFNDRLIELAKKNGSADGTLLITHVGSQSDPASVHAVEPADELVQLPRIVVAIDNLAELSLDAFDEIDPLLARLVRRGHLAGVHLILVADRPSASVVGGAVKANMASRLAYRVTTATESRVVLDDVGAESLGRVGDMLFRPAGAAAERIHSAFVTDDELRAVTEHWRAQVVPEPRIEERTAPQGMRPPNYERGREIVLASGKVSTSYVQRQLRIGYNEAARIIDELEREGVVGPPDHVGRRTILTHDPPGDRPAPERESEERSNRPPFRWP